MDEFPGPFSPALVTGPDHNVWFAGGDAIYQLVTRTATSR